MTIERDHFTSAMVQYRRDENMRSADVLWLMAPPSAPEDRLRHVLEHFDTLDPRRIP